MSLPLAAVYLLTSGPPATLVEPPAEEVRAANEAGQAAPEPVGTEPKAPTTSNGSIIVTGDLEAPPGDPLEQLNLQTFELTQSVDRAFVEPVASAYQENLPTPVRRGLRNFFHNLLEPVNFLNYLLQFNPGKAFETLGRFTLNSTVGIAGLVDVAEKEPFNLPYRRNGLANTLGYYGVGPGPFLMVPLVGATSLRDFLGGLVDQSVVPLAVGKPFNTIYYAAPAYTVNSLENRIEFDEKLREINESVDPYSAMRETYLCQREAEIAELKNRPPPRDCSLEALFAAEDAGMAATSAPADAAGTIEAIENIDPGPEVEPAPPVAEEAGEVVSEPIEQSARPGLYHQSLSLENGCASLEQGVDTLHVITC